MVNDAFLLRCMSPEMAHIDEIRIRQDVGCWGQTANSLRATETTLLTHLRHWLRTARLSR